MNKSRGQAAGFTLLEVLVVLVIIVMMIGMVSLTPGNNEQEKDAEQKIFALKTLFEAYRNEAVFKNTDLGLAMDGQRILLLEYADLRNPNISSGLSIEERTKLQKNPWREYSGNLIKEYEFPEQLSYQLFIEEQQVDFEEFYDEKYGHKAVMGFLPSGEYTPFKLILNHEYDESFAVELSGKGYKRLIKKTERYEDS